MEQQVILSTHKGKFFIRYNEKNYDVVASGGFLSGKLGRFILSKHSIDRIVLELIRIDGINLETGDITLTVTECFDIGVPDTIYVVYKQINECSYLHIKYANTLKEAEEILDTLEHGRIVKKEFYSVFHEIVRVK